MRDVILASQIGSSTIEIKAKRILHVKGTHGLKVLKAANRFKRWSQSYQLTVEVLNVSANQFLEPQIKYPECKDHTYYCLLLGEELFGYPDLALGKNSITKARVRFSS